MMEPVQSGEPLSRAYLRLGGATLARHQLVTALAAGCERIACLAPSLDSELLDLQHTAERAGARFHLISGPRALSGLVTAHDELLVVSDGLVATTADALELIGRTPSILVLPAETAVPMGFERIDLNHASAGLMLLPGKLVERLNDLPPDIEPASALLRIALQAGITQRLVPQSISSGRRWLLIRDDDQANMAELEWMERSTSGRGRTPGLALASFAVRTCGPALLDAGSGARVLSIAAIVLCSLAAGAGWFGYHALAFAFCAPAWLLQHAAGMISQIQSEALGRRESLLAAEQPFGWLFDGLLAALAVSATPFVPGEALWQRAFAPLMLFGLIQLVPQLSGRRWTEWVGDRFLMALLLLGLCLAEALAPGIPSVSALLLMAGIFASRSHSDEDGLTRV